MAVGGEGVAVQENRPLPGVEGRVRAAEVSYKNGNARIQYDPTQTNLDQIKSAISATGYKAK